MEYLTEVSRMFRYPTRDEGRRAILVGGAALGFLWWIPEVIPTGRATQVLIAALISAPAWGYLSGHGFQIIRDSASGKDHQPLLPNHRLVPKSFILPAAMMAVVFLLAFAPCLVFVGIGLALPGLAAITNLLATVLGIAGFCLFPMILLRYSLAGVITAAFDYKTILDSIRKVLPPYILCVVMIALLLAAVMLIGVFLMFGAALFLGDLDRYGFVAGYVAMGIAGVWSTLALLYLLGRLHYHYEEELGWQTGTP